jgi:site-specific DNA-methyltransferase (adenine-specific)
MVTQLELMFSNEFNILSQIVWTKPNAPGYDGWKQKMKKESLRQWYAHSERIIFMEPKCEGNMNQSYFGVMLKKWRKIAGLSGHELTEMTGAYGKVNHGGAVSNWEAGRNIPSREQYEKIKNALLSTGKLTDLPEYEDVIRPFQVNKEVEFTDVWNFENVRQYKGKHPAEKPQDLLEHAILSSTYKDDIVLDCFAGSGATALAARHSGRKSVSIEIEEKWYEYICERLREEQYEQISII